MVSININYDIEDEIVILDKLCAGFMMLSAELCKLDVYEGRQTRSRYKKYVEYKRMADITFEKIKIYEVKVRRLIEAY